MLRRASAQLLASITPPLHSALGAAASAAACPSSISSSSTAGSSCSNTYGGIMHPPCSGDDRSWAGTAAQRQSGLASTSGSSHQHRGDQAWPWTFQQRSYAAKAPALAPNARALVDSGLVPATSSMLPRFKRYIPRPQLTHRIMKRKDVCDVRDMVKVYAGIGRGLDPVHVAAALTRLSHLIKYKPSSDLAAVAEAVRLLVPAIESGSGPKVSTLQYRFRLDAVTACLWALAKLPIAARAGVPSEVLDSLLARSVQNSRALYESSPHTIALLLWSISKLAAPSAGTAGESGERKASTDTGEVTGSSSSSSSIDSSTSIPGRPTPATITTVVDTILASRLSRDPQHLTLYAFLQQSSPAVLAQLSSSLASLGRLSFPLAEAVADEVRYRLTSEHRLALKQFEGRDLVGVAQGFATAGHEDVNKWLFALIAVHVAGQPHELHETKLWKPEHLSHLAAAFALAGIRHSGLFKALSDAAQARMAQTRAWALVQMKEAYDALGYSEVWLNEAVVQQQHGAGQ